MNNDMRIEYYLLQLDRELQPLPVSQRAEIITEIKSHIRDVMEKNPARGIEQVLQDLGPARTVAERYLAAKGVQPVRKSSQGRKVFKWLAIGTVAFFAFIFILGITTVMYFSPILKVDEKKGRVELFGGLIDINEEIGKVKLGDIEINNMGDSVNVEGAEDVGENIKTIKIPFNSAKLALLASVDGRLSWHCKVTSQRTPEVHAVAGVLTLNLDMLGLTKCEIRIPSSARTEVSGVNGHMEVHYPASDLTIAVDNGRVKIQPDPSKVYDFDVKVKNGLQDMFPRSKDKDAVKVKVSVLNGLVKKE